MRMLKSPCDLVGLNARGTSPSPVRWVVQTGPVPLLGTVVATRHVADGVLEALAFPDLDERCPSVPEGAEALGRDLGDALLAWLGGSDDALWALPLAPAATAFQRNVREALRSIPRGEVFTYGQLAARIGSSHASRATGRACGANPLPLVVPCHRVVGACGAPGGFGLGLDAKRRLLAVEGVHLDALPRRPVGGKHLSCSLDWLKISAGSKPA